MFDTSNFTSYKGKFSNLDNNLLFGDFYDIMDNASIDLNFISRSAVKTAFLRIKRSKILIYF